MNDPAFVSSEPKAWSAAGAFFSQRRKRRRLAIPLFLFLVAFLSHTYAQDNTLYGKIVLTETEAPAVNAPVQVLSPKGNLHKYTLSDTTGYYEIPNLEAGTWTLKVKYLGYRDTSVTVTLSAGENRRVDFGLKEVAYNLPGVTVLDKLIGMKKEGDTLKYNLRAYTDGHDQTLGEIMEKLPGLEVNEDGDVEFNSKKVNALLLEGKEVVGEQHKLATEGLQSEAVESIHVIENYKDITDRYKNADETDKVAVDVKLKKSHQSRWTGNASALGGTNATARMETNLFNIGSKAGWTVFGRYNNIGEAPVPLRVGERLKEQQERAKRNVLLISSDPREEEASSASLTGLSRGVISNSDFHLSVNGDLQWGESVRNRTHLQATRFARKSKNEITRNYLQNDFSESFTRETDQSATVLNLQNETYLELNDRQLLQVNLPMDYQRPGYDMSEAGAFNEQTFGQNQETGEDRLQLQPHIQWTYRVNDSLSVQASTQLIYQQHQNDRHFQSADPFLNIEEPMADGHFRFVQDMEYRNRAIRTDFEWRKEWRTFTLAYYAQGLHQRESLNLRQQGAPGQTAQLQRNILQNSLKGKWKGKYFSLVGLLNAGNIHLQTHQGTTHEAGFLNPSVALYKPLPNHQQIGISFQRSIWVPTLFQTHPLPMVQTPRSIEQPGLPLSALARTQTLRATWSTDIESITQKGLLYQITVGYSEIEGDYIRQAKAGEGFVTNQLITVPQIRQFTFKGQYTQISGLKKWNLSLWLNYSDGYTALAGALSPLQAWQWSFEADYKRFQWGRWQFSPELRVQQSGQRSVVLDGRFLTADVGGKLQYATSKWRVMLSGRQQFNFGEQNTQALLLDTRITYNISQSWVALLQGNNLFNLQSTTLQSAFFQPDFTQIERYQTFPGQVMAGLKFIF